MKLKAETQKLYDDLSKSYNIKDPAGLLLLRTVCEALESYRAASAQVQKTGPVYYDRYGQPKKNPACDVARDARAGMLSALRMLNLDIEIIDHAI